MMPDGTIAPFLLFLAILTVPIGVAAIVHARKHQKFPSDFATMWATVIGVVAAGGTLLFLYDEAKLIVENQNAQAYANVYQSQLGFDQIEEQHYELTKYFERNAAMPSDIDTADKVRMVAEHKLDVIDYFFSQKDNVKIRDDEYRAWLKYFKMSFSQSQVLCQVLSDRREAYSANVYAIASYSGCAHYPKLTHDAELAIEKDFREPAQ